jgi:hypothetical protein
MLTVVENSSQMFVKVKVKQRFANAVTILTHQGPTSSSSQRIGGSSGMQSNVAVVEDWTVRTGLLGIG